ncbi:uncharacterized protein si:dkey-86e18.1 isoform X1 [Stegostoma tigrinum]|uniref:uncharacterized protein si:dkey-86e18.1 isoform X1 n=1 Tax=Stegostoma tigrinum TaxID=3053191 RepID=UPI002870508A|nr:uncharacterized protein si:dkey-86e18.1 isoform X1 [Stegostoma tigrinum]
MARNEEKHLGRLNRLWLQREKEEGRLRGRDQNRPKLSSLTSAVEVKKWIPSIKSEIEYYLQQSQLSHYSERKIKEFQDQIEELQKEYQRYLWKLRRLDPSHKEHPWKPRAYTRKRQPNAATRPISQPAGLHSLKQICIPVLNNTEADNQEDDCDGKPVEEREKNFLNQQTPLGVNDDFCMVNSSFQDQPLMFNPVRIPPRFSMASNTQNTLGEGSHHMSKILFTHLPNLQTSSSCGTTAELQSNEGKKHTFKTSVVSQETSSQMKSSGILGLSCYSSDEDK